MKRTFKFFAIFLVVCFTAISVLSIVAAVNPTFREKMELALKIDDENSISSLKNQIAEKDEQINGYEARIEDLKANISDLEETTNKLQIEDKELKAEIERLKARVQELENQAENLNGNIDELNSQIEAMNKEVDELWNIFNNLTKYENALNNGTSTETELTESEKALLEEKIENLEETISELTNEIEDLNETISDLTNQIEDLENQKIKIQNDKIVNENIIVDRTKTIEELNVTINNYYKDIENIDNSIENNTITINKLTSKIDNGEALTDEEQKQLTDLQTANENLKSQKYDINKNLTECENRVAVLQSEVEILVKNNENYSKQIASLDEQITTLENEISVLENETINVRLNINSLQSKIDKFNGLISNSTIKNENGDVVQEPSNPVNPEQPENPVEPENPTYESIFKLPLEEFETSEDVKSYLKNNKITYQEVEVTDEQTALFPNAEVIYSIILDETTQGMVIVYSDESSASAIFDSIEANRENIENGGQVTIQYVNASRNIGIVELVYNGSIGGGNEEHTHSISYYKTEEVMSESGVLENVKIGYCDCGEELSREVVPTTLKFVINGVEYTYEAGMNWKEFINSEYNTNGTFYYLDDGSVGSFSADGEQLVLCAWNDGNYVLYSDVISADINYILTKIHTCFVNNYNIENEVTLDDGSRQYDKVAYCSCGKEVSRETITEEHTHNPGEAVRENEIQNGHSLSYDLVQYCKDCGKEVSREGFSEHICFVDSYKIENEVTLDDGSRQYDYVGYCYCGTEISRETIVEKAEAKTVFTIDGVEYAYKEGMTWSDYAVNPEYNSIGLYVRDGSNLVYVNASMLYTSEGNTVYGTDLIQSTTYEIMS